MKKMSVVILLIIFLYNLLPACSGLYISNDEVKLFGLNEDFYNYNTFYTSVPATASTYGVIGFGHTGVQAIINEKGLCYDGYGAPEQELVNTNNLPVNEGTFIIQAMTTCETVAEVEELFNQQFHPWLSASQVVFTDRLGNSAIFEGDTILHKTGEYQICTNFYQSNPESGIPHFYPCWRYDLMLRNLQNTSDYSIDFVRNLLDSVHVENQTSPYGPISSVYSLIIDLNNFKIHVYNLYNYNNTVVLDIAEELDKEQQYMTLTSLFNVGIGEKKTEIETFTLHQNFPNPFNPETTIRFKVHKWANILLQVYSVDGKLIKTLINDQKTIGEYLIKWNGESNGGQVVASGIYYCRLAVGKEVQTKKMVLVR